MVEASAGSSQFDVEQTRALPISPDVLGSGRLFPSILDAGLASGLWRGSTRGDWLPAGFR